MIYRRRLGRTGKAQCVVIPDELIIACEWPEGCHLEVIKDPDVPHGVKIATPGAFEPPVEASAGEDGEQTSD